MNKVVKPTEINGYADRQPAISKWTTITQEMVNDFADVTKDYQFIHVDVEKAKQTPFGGTIAHGFLTLSMMPVLADEPHMVATMEGLTMALNYGFNSIRFLTPVRVGKRVRAKITLLDIKQRAENQYLFRQHYEVEIEGEEKPAVIAEWLLLQITG